MQLRRKQALNRQAARLILRGVEEHLTGKIGGEMFVSLVLDCTIQLALVEHDTCATTQSEKR